MDALAGYSYKKEGNEMLRRPLANLMAMMSYTKHYRPDRGLSEYMKAEHCHMREEHQA